MKKSELLPLVTFKSTGYYKNYFEEYGKVKVKINEIKGNNVSAYIEGFGTYAWIPISALELYEKDSLIEKQKDYELKRLKDKERMSGGGSSMHY